MTLKQFLKPDWRKIVILLVLIILIIVYFLTRPPWKGSFFEHFIEFVILGPSTFSALLCPMYTAAVGGIVAPICYTIFFGMIINAIYLYVISCLILWIYEKINFFKINKKKAIITIILTIILFVLYLILRINPLVFLIHIIASPGRAISGAWIDVIYSEIFILIIESYIISCLIVWVHNKYIKKRSKK
jgi:hypothetical protein